MQSMRGKCTVNSTHLVRHQQAAICDQKARINARMQNQNAEREGVAETVRILTEKSPSFDSFAPPGQSALHNSFYFEFS